MVGRLDVVLREMGVLGLVSRLATAPVLCLTGVLVAEGVVARGAREAPVVVPVVGVPPLAEFRRREVVLPRTIGEGVVRDAGLVVLGLA